MKVFFALAVAFTMFSAGYIKSGSMKKRAKRMREIQLFMKLLKPRTQYLHEPLYRTVEVLSRCEALSELRFLKECAERCESGTDFPKAWSEAVRNTELKKQDAELLRSFGEALSSANTTEISGVMELYEIQIERRVKETEEETRSDSKMYMSLFSAIGILLGIIIL